jgi:hypothetical protein
MAETLSKLTPDPDLQCYFFEPTGIAALSQASSTGFILSGTWRQQFDWVVVEWNRDNVFEHPDFRYLPDGDFSGITLTYQETRQNCIPLDSTLYPTVDWPSLRIWADPGTGEQVYKVPLLNYAVPSQGTYQPATAQVQLSGTPRQGDYVGIAFLEEHYPYQFYANDTLVNAVTNIVAGINAFSPTVQAVQNGTQILLSYLGTSPSGSRQSPENSTTGANGNRIGLYTYVSGSGSASWNAASVQFTGGTSPTEWQITVPFASLKDPALGAIPVQSVRKMRWTYSADLQPSAFQRSEFQVAVSNWQVSGTNTSYSVAGPGSTRIDDSDPAVQYSTGWTTTTGNYYGGTIAYATATGSQLTCVYTSAQQHSLYLGTRLAENFPTVSVCVDHGAPMLFNLNLPGEDVLVRKLLGQFGPGTHTVTATNTGPAGSYFYFDFVEAAIPAAALPENDMEPTMTLATDWDTYHSMALAPERTAWMINSLGFQGRVNHYVGALWFYELTNPVAQYASASVTFAGSPDPNLTTQVLIGQGGETTPLNHLNLIGDTTETVALAFAMQINTGYTAIWAQASGSTLTIYSRAIGAQGNAITISASPSTANLTVTVSATNFGGGIDGTWLTDLTATPRLNRAARDWTRAFCAALKRYGHAAVTTSFSTELGNGDPSLAAGIAQRYPDQTAVIVSTPALQTNFSPQSVAFWQQVYSDAAQLQVDTGLQPYLQFGEVQWWYFPDDGSGMPFYDAYTTSAFQAQYGRPMQVITSNTVDPSTLPEEASFLPQLIGAHTSQIMAYVRTSFPTCRFEVLYPTDVNASALDQVVNFPCSAWTPRVLDCLKTESFSYTFGRNLNLASQTVSFGQSLDFPPSQRSHLVGIEDASTPWLKEARLAQASGFESEVLWALDQFCLIGYPLPLSQGFRRSTQLG